MDIITAAFINSLKACLTTEHGSWLLLWLNHHKFFFHWIDQNNTSVEARSVLNVQTDVIRDYS